jgi:hypothetical protein
MYIAITMVEALDMHIYRVGQICVYALYMTVLYMHCKFGDFPAKNTVCTPYIYGSGQPYSYSICIQMSVPQICDQG